MVLSESESSLNFDHREVLNDREVSSDSKKLKLDKDDIDSFHIEGMKYLKVRTFRGKVLIDIREYYDAGGDIRPGKKGISLSATQWKKVVSLVGEVDEALKKV
ncbi:activated RNA polymerase II transcriptional coactivator p15 isoform X2 [Macrosteles quadrilineatus]|uniref:activated RNA polymerase II transcriptional coactivator p15 isoform X2 n=1 Tax=Macrosteles quadrilineatus TaxID=74068 RepID=UPI0023E25590|nr:activated RNA polymerase II transcriptional coactivator p15 isoform X2 [Macrosteles quadrilineatus]